MSFSIFVMSNFAGFSEENELTVYIDVSKLQYQSLQQYDILWSASQWKIYFMYL